MKMENEFSAKLHVLLNEVLLKRIDVVMYL